MKKLKLTITGEINSRLYDEILQTVINQNGIEEIILIINSTGGSVAIAIAIYDLIKSLNVKTTTIVLGKCYSMATILFALGERRYIGKNAEYMLHQTNYNFAKDVRVSSGELREMVRCANEDEQRWKMILERSSKEGTSEFINKVFSSKDDIFLSAKQAITMGFATDELENIKNIL